jgi:hypothetical protein
LTSKDVSKSDKDTSRHDPWLFYFWNAGKRLTPKENTELLFEDCKAMD